MYLADLSVLNQNNINNCTIYAFIKLTFDIMS